MRAFVFPLLTWQEAFDLDPMGFLDALETCSWDLEHGRRLWGLRRGLREVSRFSVDRRSA